jgi:predicted transcriptional regulator
MHRPVITVQSDEPVRKAVNLMEKHGISQLPVLEKNVVVGSVQEGTLIKKIFQSKNPEEVFRTKLRNIMEEVFPILGPNAGIEEALAALIREKPAVLVMDKGRLMGIITKMDIIMGMRSSR